MSGDERRLLGACGAYLSVTLTEAIALLDRVMASKAQSDADRAAWNRVRPLLVEAARSQRSEDDTREVPT